MAYEGGVYLLQTADQNLVYSVDAMIGLGLSSPAEPVLNHRYLLRLQPVGRDQGGPESTRPPNSTNGTRPNDTLWARPGFCRTGFTCR